LKYSSSGRIPDHKNIGWLGVYREMKNAIFVKTPDPPGANRVRYRRKQNIKIPVFIRFVYGQTIPFVEAPEIKV
jgi:hypothetical protein